MTGRWYHIVGVWAAANSRSLYIDGVFQATNTANRVPSTIDRTFIGQFADLTPNWELRGQLASVVFHSRALTAKEIADDHNNPHRLITPVSSTPLVSGAGTILPHMMQLSN